MLVLWNVEKSKDQDQDSNHELHIYTVFCSAHFDAGNSTSCATGAGLPTLLQLVYCFLSIYRWNS